MTRTMMLSLSVVAAAAFTGPVFSAVYSQPSDEPTLPSFFSDAIPGQFFSQRMADNFTLDADATATGLRWWGSSQNFAFDDLSNMASFTVLIMKSDGAGAPDLGNVVFSDTYSATDSNATATGFLNGNGGIEYVHEIALPDLVFSADNQYWVSIGATLEAPAGDAWVWSRSSVGDLVNATDFFDGSGFVVFDPTFNDLAFEIIPAPHALAMFGLAGLFARRRR